jgi:hypothetical protein
MRLQSASTVIAARKDKALKKKLFLGFTFFHFGNADGSAARAWSEWAMYHVIGDD